MHMDIKNLYWRENRCTCHTISILVDQILDGSIRNSSILHWFIIPYIYIYSICSVAKSSSYTHAIMVVSPSFLTFTIKFLHIFPFFPMISGVFPWFSHVFSPGVAPRAAAAPRARRRCRSATAARRSSCRAPSRGRKHQADTETRWKMGWFVGENLQETIWFLRSFLYHQI